MHWASTLMLLFVVSTFLSETSRGETYLQLISTRYQEGAKLPDDFQRPKVPRDFVSSLKLPPDSKIRSVAQAAPGIAWVVTDRGTFRASKEGYEPLEVGPRRLEPGQPNVKGDARIVTVASDTVGHIWVATDRGLYVTDGAEWWQSLDRNDGLPCETTTCLHLAPNGDVWGGTPQGAWRLRDGHFRYFQGPRWLPDDHVREVWTDAKGGAWIETARGYAHIVEQAITLADKAKHFDQITRERHSRRGYIAEIDLKVAGDPSQGYTFRVSDNDGLWTSMYVAAMALRFGATKDPAARELAHRSLEALLDLERLSGIPGYLARSMVTDEEIAEGIHGVRLEQKVNAPGEDAKIWFRSRVQPNLWCKGDTSSDALTGPYLAWYLYHDLVADEAEKKEIAAVVKRVTDHIIDHGLNLIGHTGQRTRWGIWAPELINHHPFYYDLRPLNSLEILSFLKVAEHITGDNKYGQAAEELITKHHYLLNSLMIRRGTIGHWPDINHSDDELHYLVVYPLYRLEKDPAKRRILAQSLARTWEEPSREQTLRAEHSPFYNFIYGAATGRRCDVEGAVQTLEDWPWELINWPTRNSNRHDVQVLTMSGIHRHPTQLDRVLPASERSQGRWNTSPWVADAGGNGLAEHDGVAWTLSYWLGVYHGYLPAKP